MYNITLRQVIGDLRPLVELIDRKRKVGSIVTHYEPKYGEVGRFAFYCDEPALLEIEITDQSGAIHRAGFFKTQVRKAGQYINGYGVTLLDPVPLDLGGRLIPGNEPENWLATITIKAAVPA